jgi:hypothetical protein
LIHPQKGLLPGNITSRLFHLLSAQLVDLSASKKRLERRLSHPFMNEPG